MIRVAVCDDNPSDLSRIRALLQNCGTPFSITGYTNAENLLWDIETNQSRFDIYLLDIYLKEISGINAARRIRALDESAILIFTTSSRDFYQDAFEVYAFNYLIKPVEQSALNDVMERAVRATQRLQEKVLPITYHGETFLLRHEQIEYISSSNRILCFHLRGGIKRQCYGKLDEIAEQLKNGIFVRCHQSYIVNLHYVLERTPEGFHMESKTIPISRSYAAKAQEAINQYLFGIFENN